MDPMPGCKAGVGMEGDFGLHPGSSINSMD